MSVLLGRLILARAGYRVAKQQRNRAIAAGCAIVIVIGKRFELSEQEFFVTEQEFFIGEQEFFITFWVFSCSSYVSWIQATRLRDY